MPVNISHDLEIERAYMMLTFAVEDEKKAKLTYESTQKKVRIAQAELNRLITLKRNAT